MPLFNVTINNRGTKAFCPAVSGETAFAAARTAVREHYHREKMPEAAFNGTGTLLSGQSWEGDVVRLSPNGWYNRVIVPGVVVTAEPCAPP